MHMQMEKAQPGTDRSMRPLLSDADEEWAEPHI